jgi:hypothetical protein
MNSNLWSNFTFRELRIFISPWNYSILLTLAFILKQFIDAVSIYLYNTAIELFKESSVLIATQNVRPCIWLIDHFH